MLSLILKSLSLPIAKYTDGVGMGLGNGLDSVLNVEKTNIFTSSTTAEISIPERRAKYLI
jgi:hypothetical protein